MKHVRWRLVGIVAGMAALGCGAAAAQEAGEAELDALIDATESDAGTLAAARRQVGAGNLTGAAATLERSLLLRPDAGSDEVRLYYGTVLCRLADYRGGAYQLANVRNATATGWAEAREACAPARLTPFATRGDGVTGVLSLGLGYETDALGALTTQIEIPGFPAPSEEGLAITASGALDARFASRLSGQGYAGAAFETRMDISGPDADYLTGSARLGYDFRLRGEDQRLAAGLMARHGRLAGDGLVTEYGLQAELGDTASPTGRWTVRLEAVDQDYLGPAAASLRDGMRYDVMLSYRETSGADRAWTAGVAVEAKQAEQTDLGYVGGRVFAAMQTPIADNGAYIGGSAMLRYIDFREGALGGGETEMRSYVRAVVGVPLDRDGLFLEAAASHSARWYDSASPLHDHSSFGAEVRMVYRFGRSGSPQ